MRKKKSLTERKWYAVKPKRSNGWYYIRTSNNLEICTCYSEDVKQVANRIVTDHNESLKRERN